MHLVIKMLRQLTLLVLIASAFAGPTAHVPLLDGRIVGGQPVDISQYPHQLSLQYYGSHICGASIISANVALTAAHCTSGSSASVLSVRAGSSIQGSGGDVVKVSRIIQNANYDSRVIDYDVSVLILSRSLNAGKAISLASDNQNIPAGTVATVSGWGTLSEGGSSSSQLQAVSVPVVSQATCQSAYGSSAITDRMLCAGGSGGKDSCQGDSGGPLIYGGIQIGVVSWGYGCARPSYPGVYSSVANLRSWIKSAAGV